MQAVNEARRRSEISSPFDLLFKPRLKGFNMLVKNPSEIIKVVYLMFAL